MNNWLIKKIGDFCHLSQGLAINAKTKHLVIEKSELPLLRIKDLLENTQEQFIDPVLVPSQCIVEPTELIMTRTGQVGYVFMGKRGVVHNNSFKISVIDTAIDTRFLYWHFNSKEQREYLTSIAAGSVQPDLNHKTFKDYSLLIPSLPEQKAIAAVLSSLDNKIDLLHRQNKTLEAMADTLFRQWFIEEAEEDWEEVSLEDVCLRITDGAHTSPPSVDNGYSMASVKDMYSWGITETTCRKISKEDYEELVNADCKAIRGDILIAKDGSYLKHVFLVEKDLDVVLLSSVAMLRPNGKYHPMLLTIFLKLKSTHDEMQNIVTGAVIPRIVLKDFRKFPIILPPKELQNRAAEIIRPIFEKCWFNNKKIQTLQHLRDTLLPKLMSGEVRVQYEAEQAA